MFLSLGYHNHKAHSNNGNQDACYDVCCQRFSEDHCPDQNSGSKTPNTEALVAPMFLEAIARVAVDTIVGRTARPMRLPQAIAPSIPDMSSAAESEHLVKNTTVPTIRA